MRRTVRITLEEDRITYGIETADGSFDNFSVEVPGGLPFTRGIAQFKTHAYTPATSANNTSTYTFHWDNLRFSGPVLEPYEAYRASDVVYLQRNGDRPIGDSQTVTIDMPDTIGENPVLVGQMNGSLRGQALLSINGQPNQTVEIDDYQLDNCVSGMWRDWNSFRLELDEGVLQPGENTLRFEVGPRPACATDDGWWDGYSVKFLHVQVDAAQAAAAPQIVRPAPPQIEVLSP